MYHGDDGEESSGADNKDQEGDDDGDNAGGVDVGASCMWFQWMRTPWVGKIRSASQRIGIRWALVNDGPMETPCVLSLRAGGLWIGTPWALTLCISQICIGAIWGAVICP